MAQSLTIRFPEGTTFRQQVTVRSKSGSAAPVPVDLTTAALNFAVYETSAGKVGSIATVLSKSIGSGIVLVDAAAGVARIDFAPAETVDMAGNYEWELELVESGGDVYLVGLGKFILEPARRLDV